jgi:ribose 5-phosphate isomerase B
MTINPPLAIAADHGGFDLKEALKSALINYDWLDLGCYDMGSVDYNDYADSMAGAIQDGKVTRGILICGTGIGISMAANRYPHLRAALCTNATMARLTRQHNDANILCLGARIIGVELAIDITQIFLNTDFDGGQRHARRVHKLGHHI